MLKVLIDGDVILTIKAKKRADGQYKAKGPISSDTAGTRRGALLSVLATELMQFEEVKQALQAQSTK